MDEIEKQITYFKILKNRRSLSAFLICNFAMIASLFVDPVLSIRLMYLGMSPDNVGFAFATLGGMQTLGAPVTGYLGKFIPVRIIQ